MGVGVYGGKDFWKRYVFSLEWKSERVMDDDSGDSEEDEGEKDWLRQGWHRFSSFASLTYILVYPSFLSVIVYSIKKLSNEYGKNQECIMLPALQNARTGPSTIDVLYRGKEVGSGVNMDDKSTETVLKPRLPKYSLVYCRMAFIPGLRRKYSPQGLVYPFDTSCPLHCPLDSNQQHRGKGYSQRDYQCSQLYNN